MASIQTYFLASATADLQVNRTQAFLSTCKSLPKQTEIFMFMVITQLGTQTDPGIAEEIPK